jgi:hypothetical protein
LTAKVLYRDSSTTAGDALVRRVIERVLLPAIGARLDNAQRTTFAAMLAKEKGSQCAAWNRITRQVFLPIVYAWLSAAAKASVPRDPAPRPDELHISGTLFNEFNFFCRTAGLPEGLLDPGTVLNYDRECLARCIRENFAGLFASLAKVSEAFDCDLALVSGKPSELEALKQLLCSELPLLPQRIVFLKNVAVGQWYPLSTDGRIHDAKAVTVAGAALDQAIRSGLFENPRWHLTRTVSPYLLCRNYWGTMPIGAGTAFRQVLLTPVDMEQAGCRLHIGARLGRRLLPAETRPEPVYQLRWRDQRRYKETGRDGVSARLEVTLRRVLPAPVPDREFSPAALSESVELTAAKAVDHSGCEIPWSGRLVTANDVELALCTLETDSHWLDAGTFHVLWPTRDEDDPHRAAGQ